MEWLSSMGARVFLPVGHSPDVDLIADVGGRLLRVQVKTSTCRNDHGRWGVTIATRGGNQSWTGLVKYFDPSTCDFLFVQVGDGRRWFIPANEIEGRTGLTLGGQKYSEFEVELGRPLSREAALESNETRGSAGVGEPGWSVKSVPRAEWVRFPPPPSSSPAGNEAGSRQPSVGRTRISRNHQLTIPTTPFERAGLEVGDMFRVEATGVGRLTLTRAEEFRNDQEALFPRGELDQ